MLRIWIRFDIYYSGIAVRIPTEFADSISQPTPGRPIPFIQGVALGINTDVPNDTEHMQEAEYDELKGDHAGSLTVPSTR